MSTRKQKILKMVEALIQDNNTEAEECLSDYLTGISRTAIREGKSVTVITKDQFVKLSKDQKKMYNYDSKTKEYIKKAKHSLYV